MYFYGEIMKKEQEENQFEGFSFISDQIISKGDKDENFIPEEETEKAEEEEEIISEETEETQEINEGSEKETIPEEETEKEDNEVSEVEMVTPFVELFNKELGWEFNEEESPKSIKDLLKYMSDVIDSNSKPSYANEVVEKFDKYVKDGGDPYTFLNESYKGIDYDKADTEDEATQKELIRELYKEKGFKDKKITRLIEKHELDDELKDEAIEALEELKEIKSQKVEIITASKKEEKKAAVKEQQAFVDLAVNKISKIEEIGGVPISKKEKDLLLPYLFTQDKEGKTPLQKDYEKNPVDYLITTAYFYQNQANIKNKLKKSATTSAVADFKQTQKDILQRKKNKKDASSSEEVEGFEAFSNISKKITG